DRAATCPILIGSCASAPASVAMARGKAMPSPPSAAALCIDGAFHIAIPLLILGRSAPGAHSGTIGVACPSPPSLPRIRGPCDSGALPFACAVCPQHEHRARQALPARCVTYAAHAGKGRGNGADLPRKQRADRPVQRLGARSLGGRAQECARKWPV